MKRRAILAVALALLLLALFVTAVGWEQVLGAVEDADPVVYAGAFFATLVCFGFRSAVWQTVLVVVDERRPYWLIGGVFLTASFAKYVTPYGQLASGVGVAAIVSRYTDAAYEEGLAAVLSADFLNYLPYYTFGVGSLAAVFLFQSPPIDLRRYGPLVGGVVVVVCLSVAILWRRRSLVTTFVVKLLSPIRSIVSRVSQRRARLLTRENVETRLDGFYATLDLVSRNRRSMGIALCYAHVGWLGLALAMYLTALALDARITFTVAVLAVAVSKVGFVLPTPGGIGGVEATIATALFLVAPVTFAVATAIAILYRFATYWFTVFLGGSASFALTISDPLPPGAEK